jgi:hypothetical protein
LSEDLKVKKVKAYPFPVKLTHGAEVITGQLVKLTQIGFLAEVPLGGLKSGDKCECEFTTPVLNQIVLLPCIVVKLYTQRTTGTNPAIQIPPADGKPETAADKNAPAGTSPKTIMLIEFHFGATTAQAREAIVAFINAANKAAPPAKPAK